MRIVRLKAVVGQGGTPFDLFVNPEAVDLFYPLGSGHVQLRFRGGGTFVINESIDNVAHALGAMECE